ncbi:hypothetical protein PFAG_04369 [Plasmodium falciparum Santa Lucia]|uniref:Uncharacterized protein n=1 Tax=Plasmodium falciparum Santa Lucia TaxID=478859 RepID=W7FTV3_PLAFA|nr:hypothetical protein PFAG_04369 [Plasmodium falciparum Santa Lucia]
MNFSLYYACRVLVQYDLVKNIIQVKIPQKCLFEKINLKKIERGATLYYLYITLL